MRRQLAALVLATTALVIIAFLVPLAFLVARTAADRALRAASLQAGQLVPLVGSGDRDALRLVVGQLDADRGSRVSVFLADGEIVGAAARRTDAVRLARRGRAFSAERDGGREILTPVQGVEGGAAVIRVFVPGSTLRDGVVRAWAVLAALGIALLVLGVLLADRLARRLVAPTRALAATADRLGRGDLSARVTPEGPPELRRVGSELNRLATRIGELLVAEREAVADLSHRLRTPITALRLDVEALEGSEATRRLVDDVDALAASVDAVIREARRPVREGATATCDATAVARERAGFWSALAEEEQRRMATELPAAPCLVRASAADLAAALDALVGNVLAHTPEGSAFAIRLQPGAAGGATLTVEDDGPGIRSEWAFARGSSGGESTGLGLDIARRTAEAAGGRLVTDTAAGGGARVQLELGAP